MVIDAHIHLYPPEVFADPGAWGAARRENGWLRCVAPTGRRSLQGWASVDTLLRDMDAAGVDRAVLLGWYWENHDTARLQNRWYAGWIRDHPDRLAAFAALAPAAGSPVLEDARRALDDGFCGFGEFLPAAQGFSLSNDTWTGILALAREAGVPVNLHVTDPAAPIPAEVALPTPLPELVDLVRRHPENRFILAHWGGGLPFYELNRPLHSLFRNVWYDSAASALLYDPSIYRRVCDLIGAERMLFGTDYPLLTHPRLSRQPTFVHDLADARAAGLMPEELARVLGGNARQLLRF